MNETEIIKRAEDLAAKVKECSSSEKYEKAARILASANTVLLITLIWKSFEIGAGISWIAKISMFFFLLGTTAIVLRYLFDFLRDGVELMPLFKDITDFFDTNKDTIQRLKPEEFENWKLISMGYKTTDKVFLQLTNQNRPPNGLIVGGYLFLDFLSFFISGLAFSIGCLLLFFSALAN